MAAHWPSCNTNNHWRKKDSLFTHEEEEEEEEDDDDDDEEEEEGLGLFRIIKTTKLYQLLYTPNV